MKNLIPTQTDLKFNVSIHRKARKSNLVMEYVHKTHEREYNFKILFLAPELNKKQNDFLQLELRTENDYIKHSFNCSDITGVVEEIKSFVNDNK